MNLILIRSILNLLIYFIILSEIICTIRISSFKYDTMNIYNLLPRNKNIKYKSILYKKYKDKFLSKNKRLLNELNSKCSIIDSKNKSLCLECNKKDGYYPIYYDYNYDNKKILLKKYIKNSIDCYNQSTILDGYYLNENLEAYEKCFESCKSCYGNGNRIFHNCSTCLDNYIFQPEIPNSTNCVPKCKYYYYYSFLGEYKCTDNYHCPEKINLVVENENKCLSDCKHDSNYIYQYNGECLLQCPKNTNTNSQKICLDSDIEKCTITIKNINLNSKSLNNKILDEMAITYANEFLYNQNHISQFKLDNYSIIFLKNISCMQEFQLTFSHIIFDECIDKIINLYNLTLYPIIAIIDNIDCLGNLNTKYILYNPETGIKLNTSICSNSSIIIKKQIPSFIKDKLNWLIIQNIDILNISSPFYSNICFHFKSHNGKDMTLKDRFLYYYPNISFCNENCKYKNINYDTMVATCICNYTDFPYYFNFFSDEIIKELYNNVIKGFIYIYEILESKTTLLFCYKNLFNNKYFFNNIGGIILIILIIIQICCTISFSCKEFKSINNYILFVLNYYIKIIKMKNNENNYNQIYINKNNSSILLNNNNPKILMRAKTFPMTKIIKIQSTDENFKNMNAKILENSDISSSKISNKFESSLNILITQSDSAFKELNSLKNKNNKNKKNKNNEINENNSNNSNNSNNKFKIKSFRKKEIKNYLNESFDEMEPYEVLKEDKRKFCQFYCDKIKKNQLLMRTFIYKEKTIPIELKIILFILYIDFFLLLMHFILQMNV